MCTQERLMHALAADHVPESWAAIAYPSQRLLGSWMHNLLQRVAQIQEWCADMNVPKSVWLSGYAEMCAVIAWLMASIQNSMQNWCCSLVFNHIWQMMQAVQPPVFPYCRQADNSTSQ